MKKKIILCLILTNLLAINVLSGFAQEKTNNKDGSVEINEKTGFPEIKKTPFVVWQEGLTGCFGSRIIKKNDRSNFVWQEYMAGAFFGFKTRNMEPINSTVRVSLYYPLLCNFNEVPQVYKNVIRFDADLFAAPIVEFNMWEYVRFNAAFGLNVNVESTDRFLYVNIGPGALLGLELPVARHWTIQVDGLVCYDFADVGNNRNIEPVDYSFRYQLSLGVRYSQKDPNVYSYVPMSEEKIMTIQAKNDAKEAAKQAAKAKKAEEKAIKAEKAAEEKAAKKAVAEKEAAKIDVSKENSSNKIETTGN